MLVYKEYTAVGIVFWSVLVLEFCDAAKCGSLEVAI